MITAQGILEELLESLTTKRDTSIIRRDRSENLQRQAVAEGNPWADSWNSTIHTAQLKADLCASILNDLFSFINLGYNPEETVQKVLDNTEGLIDRILESSRASIVAVTYHVKCEQSVLKEYLRRLKIIKEHQMIRISY